MEVKNEPRTIRSDIAVAEYLRKLDSSIGEYDAIYINVSKLENSNIRDSHRQELADTFAAFVSKTMARYFWFANEDVIVIYNRRIKDEILSCLVKIRFMFHDDPFIHNSEDLRAIGFVNFYNMVDDKKEFYHLVNKLSHQQNPLKLQTKKTTPFVVNSSPTYTAKQKKPFTPDILARVQKILSVADFSSFIRRQAICAIIGKSTPLRVFEEVYVSIPDLREMLMPDIDLLADPWLFLSLSETLDKRVLETISRHDDGSLIGNFSININVSTILSNEFLAFDESISASMRPSIILELQLVDIFSDIKSFVLAKTFVQARGYKICIDGISVDKLKYLNRTNLNCDLMKIIWHPSFMDVINEDKHFMDYVNKAERAKMILCRIDDPSAIEIGNSLGINLYQGRYVQRLLNSTAPKVSLAKNK
ncbi:MAG: hypothetical protein IJW72_05910 [Alphaproteobacteria bacterium]|nr:EAL domain-containing protein [Alphaproteobacteria bacterium]MBQ7285768.1 hypothetical protein [Alphaproteobacteria bacterium]